MLVTGFFLIFFLVEVSFLRFSAGKYQGEKASADKKFFG